MGAKKRGRGASKEEQKGREKQRQKVEAELDDDEYRSGGESDQESPDEEEINVDFDFFDPEEGHFHQIKRFLGQTFDGKKFDLSSAADHVIAQKTVGTVIRTSDGDKDDILGFISVINTGISKGNNFVKQVKSFLLQHAPKKNKDKLASLLESDKTGLLIGDRVVNIPHMLAGPIMRAIHDEIIWAREDEPTEAKRKYFRFENYIVVARKLEGSEAREEGEEQQEGKEGDEVVKAGIESDFGSDELFPKAEDGVIANYATMAMELPVSQSEEKQKLFAQQNAFFSEKLYAYVLPHSKLADVLNDVNELVGWDGQV